MVRYSSVFLWYFNSIASVLYRKIKKKSVEERLPLRKDPRYIKLSIRNKIL